MDNVQKVDWISEKQGTSEFATFMKLINRTLFITLFFQSLYKYVPVCLTEHT
jgi:hypothetical protein